MLRLYKRRAAYSRYLLLLAAFFIFSHTCISQYMRSFSLPSGITANDYAQDVIVIKIGRARTETNARTFSTNPNTLDTIQKISGAQKVQQIFSESAARRNSQMLSRRTSVKNALADIYKIYLQPGSDITQVINQLLQVEEVIYAEPYYFMKPLTLYDVKAEGYVPNDPEAIPVSGKQDYLTTVKAYEAWEIEKGDSSVVIGILDTGIDLGHQDLMGNLYYNVADPMNGVDDDKDGYVDNYLGWDMADHDNDPTADKDPHGTLVTGLSSATVNNTKGIAGAGFNSSYMPVKVFRSEYNIFWKGYEAIAYAADQGCKVINLSWGAVNANSYFGQDVISYAVLEKDVVIIAAAGNSGKEEYFYPASYDHVLSVAISDVKDNKLAETTYNYSIDLMAPGNSNYTTAHDDGYQYSTGSSMSAPLVAGTAALMRAKNPELSAIQVMEKLRLSADNVYAVGTNANYAEQLGYGRLNMKKALQDLTTPALRMTSIQYQNRIGAYAYAGDTLRIEMNFTNYFKPTAANATVTLAVLSPHVTLLDSVFYLGMLDSMQTRSNAENHFLVSLHEDLPTDTNLTFRLGFEDGNYSDYQYFTIRSSPDYILIDNGAIQLDMGGNGNIAFNPDKLMGGNGLLYHNTTLANQIGLMIATGADSVSDNVVKDFQIGSRSEDFKILEAITIPTLEMGGITVRSAFSDKAAQYPLGLRIEQTWLADNTAGNQQFIIAEYRTVALEDTLNNLHMGIFADWNLGDLNSNKASWDATHRLGYIYNGELYTGVALLTSQDIAFHAIDIKDLNGNNSEVGDTFTDDERYQFLSGSISKLVAGAKGAGNDVAFVIGGRKNALLHNGTETFAFTLVVGKSLVELQNAVVKAQTKYTAYLQYPVLSHTVNVCKDSITNITPPEGSLFRFYSDPVGKHFLYEGNKFTSWPIVQDTSVFFTCIDKGYESRISSVKIKMLEPVAAFAFNKHANQGLKNDTLFIDDSQNYIVEFSDLSQNAVAWEWDFGNGFKSKSQHPKSRYAKPGTYTVTLRVLSKPGCADTFLRTLTVVERSPAPIITDQRICAGSSTVLQAENSSMLKFYADVSLSQLLYQGTAFSVGPVVVDTAFYVVNTEGAYESLPKEVNISVVETGLEIIYALDTVNLLPKYEIIFDVQGAAPGITSMQWYVDDMLIGEEKSSRYDFLSQHSTGIQFTVRLDYTMVSEGSTCSFSTSKVIVPSKSDAPGFAVHYICQNDKAVVDPLEGNVFYFYKDASLSNLIHKGRTLVVDGVKGSHIYYVTRMDGLKESAAVPVTVNISQFADFSMSTDTLYLSEDHEVTLEGYTLDSSDPKQVNWNWDMGGGVFINKPFSFIQQFDTAGIYHIKLKANTADGCTNTIEKVLVVHTVSGTETKIIDKALKVYPNPSSGNITIENPHWLYEKITVRLLSMQGTVLCSEENMYANTPLLLDLSDCIRSYPQGLYFLQIENRYSSFFKKIIFSSNGR